MQPSNPDSKSNAGSARIISPFSQSSQWIPPSWSLPSSFFRSPSSYIQSFLTLFLHTKLAVSWKNSTSVTNTPMLEHLLSLEACSCFTPCRELHTMFPEKLLLQWSTPPCWNTFRAEKLALDSLHVENHPQIHLQAERTQTVPTGKCGVKLPERSYCYRTWDWCFYASWCSMFKDLA